MDFALVLDALKQRIRQDIGKLPKCRVEGCFGVAWRNGYCPDCVMHATAQRQLMEQRRTNLLLEELIENGVSMVRAGTPRTLPPRESGPAAEHLLDVKDNTFIPSIPVSGGTISGSGGKKTVVIKGTDKLDNADKIE